MRPALLLLVAVAPALAAETTTYPTAFETARYEGMMKDSPFALATAVAEPEKEKEKFSANWKWTVLGKLPVGDGESQDWVIVRSQDQRVQFTLRGKEPTNEGEASGVAIDRIEWNDNDPRKSKVYLKKGNDVELVEMAQDTAAAAPAGAPQPARPGQPGAMPPNVRLPGVPPVNGVRPGPVMNTPPAINRPPLAPVKPTLPRPGTGNNFVPNNAPIPGIRPPGPQPAPGIQQSGPARKPRVIPSAPPQ